MNRLHIGVGALIAGALLLGPIAGCDRGSADASAGGDHDGHDHGDEDHSGHDHSSHDHADDDHAGHDHGEADEPMAAGEAAHDHDDGHDHSADEPGENPRVDIPEAVRSNLGISFVTVQPRHVERTLRAPGRFEYVPTARREYRTALPGRVEMLVGQFDRVAAGDALYRLDSPAWRDLQRQISAAESEVRLLEVRVATFDPQWEAHGRHEASLTESIGALAARVEQLEAVSRAGGGRANELAQARALLASARAELAEVEEKKAQLRADRDQAQAAIGAAREHVRLLLGSAASVLGVTKQSLTEPVDVEGEQRPRWAAIGSIDVLAAEPGVVESLGMTSGGWSDDRALVMTLVQPDRLRFHASGLQSDLGVLRDGLPARIVPPTPTRSGSAVPIDQEMPGVLVIGPTGDPDARTLALFVTPDRLLPWARAGVSAQLEIVTGGGAGPVPAIPLAAVQRDGLTPVVFVRDPDHPDEAVRVEPVLGADDGRWVEVLSGVSPGGEVVLDGAFQLMLATSGSVQQGGHFHADGTFHGGDHGEEDMNDHKDGD